MNFLKSLAVLALVFLVSYGVVTACIIVVQSIALFAEVMYVR